MGRRVQKQTGREGGISQKLTVRFKLNLKTDGLDCKMIFKFGKHVERLHSCSKQCRRIYICSFCVAKYLLGIPKPLNCIVPMQARCSRKPHSSFSHSAFNAAAASASMPSFRRRAAYQRVVLSLCIPARAVSCSGRAKSATDRTSPSSGSFPSSV